MLRLTVRVLDEAQHAFFWGIGITKSKANLFEVKPIDR